MPPFIDWLLGLNPASILDVGVGFGMWGVLFRSYTDIWQARYHQWNTVIHGIEIHESYRNPLWSYIYQNVYIGDACTILPTLPQKYDLVYFGDVLEHLEKDKAKKLLAEGIKKANRYVVVSCPNTFSANKDSAVNFGNPFEEHLCCMENEDFPEGSVIDVFGNSKLVIIPVK